MFVALKVEDATGSLVVADVPLAISLSRVVAVAVWLSLAEFCLRSSLEAAAAASLGSRVELVDDEVPCFDPVSFQELLELPLVEPELLLSAFPFGVE